KYIGYFLDQVSTWQKSLSTADSVITIWFEVQRTWSYLEAIFIGSEDIRSQLPEDSKRFEGIDIDFKELVAQMEATPNVVKATNKPGLYDKLEDLQNRLALCEKALAEYLDTKRLAFPRFYFVSSADLLDILSNGTNPVAVSRHLAKLFDNMAQLKFKPDDSGNPTKTALGMFSKEKEYVEFDTPCECVGPVETWLNTLMEIMRSTVRQQMTEGNVTYEEKPREQWIFDYPAQVSLLGTQIWWTTEVNISFSRLEEGYENAIKDYYKKQINQLNTLIGLLIGNLTSNDRQNIMTICTIDVHAKDVVGKLIDQKIDSAQAFLWLSQLRLRWDDKLNHVFGNICDAQFMYSYEYLGCTPRLVITPLTDRCYITLTQSLHLTMSGAPAGPAGTGKTETTKDLGRALGIMVYVFNCSEQMDYKSIGNIYKGLAQTGAWGCFDEFNRISVEVLSVVAVQVKTIQDAIKEKRERFDFLGENIRLVPSVGLFITMNPGYAGRTELPENLKALFRPCAMVVPDFAMICEIMLVAEGFIDNRLLARKFITLYTLCRELLSKQDHYDWGLRAIKSVLVVAGALKRSDPGRAEDQVLMRALRDFNIPKIVTDDLPVFMGLIGDLFPALDVPRKRDPDFEKIVKVSHSSIFVLFCFYCKTCFLQESIVQLKLQPEDNFLLKIVQLEELLGVHKIFMFNSCPKQLVLKSLHKTYQLMKRKPMWVDINPKAVTNNELYGVINPSTREWKDGLFSTIMRDLSNVTHDGPKWIVLDGDIDPMWIESLNTVMDDNKVLTLASNERIPLTPTMRMLFEISHLKAATPATVSRAGILFVNPADLGWNPPVSSWIDQREVQSERANLTILFDKYVPPILEALKTRFKTIIPIPEQSMIQMLCYMLEVLLTPENTPPDCPKDLYELYFVFACIWAFGGAMFQDQVGEVGPLYHRVEFSKWWTTEFKTIKFPSHGTVFEYFIDNNTKKFTPWNEKVPHFELDPEMPLQVNIRVTGTRVLCWYTTPKQICVKYFMDLLMAQYRPVMLVGNAGVGKSVLVNNKLGSLDQEDYVVTNVPFNYYTTSQMLQSMFGLLEPVVIWIKYETFFDSTYFISPNIKYTDSIPETDINIQNYLFSDTPQCLVKILPNVYANIYLKIISHIRIYEDLLDINMKYSYLILNILISSNLLLFFFLNIFIHMEYFNLNIKHSSSQLCLEKPLEKKAGRNYGPPGTKRLIYFIDDINMPEVDKYGTVQPHTLIRQHMDYKHWYDRQKLSLKEIHNVQYVCCMNPTSGSFTISSRLQRHFCVFALSFPGKDAVKTIYNSIFSQHLKINKFSMAVQKQCGQLVDAALFLHTRITQVFLPTAIKFHYVFNLRDLSNIFQGMLFVTPDSVKTMTDVVKLWLHEASRVYRDKLVDDKDMHTYDELSMDISKKYFEWVKQVNLKFNNIISESWYSSKFFSFNVLIVKTNHICCIILIPFSNFANSNFANVTYQLCYPHIYCHFATGIGDPKYYPIPSWESLNRLLVEALDNYNEMNAVMNLVLFGDAMAHVCRINRIFESPRGYALLVGVGGSGKQSLSRLAAFISNLDVFQITLRKGYGIADLKIDLGALFVKAGVKNVGVLFLLTDAQVFIHIRFLVLVNDMLSTGEISDLFPDDEIEGIINGVRNEVKGMGGWLIQGRLAWRFFIDRITVHVLHSIQQVALCFSPVGSTLRVRARKFPGVVNCTAIDWFHEWPQDALESVSLRFLSDIENVEETERESISKFLSFVHMSVNDLGKEYLLNDRRYNYTTPKSFLEQITLYETLLNKKSSELQASVERLENGLEKLRSTAAQVDDLKAKLAAQEIELKQKNEDADKLIQVVGVETEKVSKEKAVADVEEEKVTAIEVEVSKKRTDCERDLAKAEPALIAAQAALDTLNKNNLTELKSFGSPPADVVNVVSAVMVLMAPGGKVPKDRSWKAGKIMMAKVDQFLDGLINYDKENIHESCLKAIKPYLDMKEFDADYIRNKSLAAAGLCAWTINIVNFYVIFCDVEPKRIALAKANADLQAAQDKLAVIKNKIAVLNSNLAELTAQFEEATAAKLKCQQQAEATQLTISLANRLVGGLTSENVRWAQSVQNFREQESKLTGNVLLVTAFVSYVGYFTKSYRLRLMDELWLPFIKSLPVPIPITDGLDYISLLTDEADIAAWNNEGLPSDRMSNENATILTNCQRWPLMVDPQLQGIKWIKNKYGKDLKVIRIGQRGYLDTIENALGVGDPVLIENIEESVDPVLGPLLGRETIKKGRQVFLVKNMGIIIFCFKNLTLSNAVNERHKFQYIKIGDKECEYHRDFRLVLHTKLANPHYQPEMQAQCTLINFTVTRDGLEDQLLADVVGMERPDLEALKLDLTKQQNDFKITLKRLEDDLLARLSAASGNFLSDTALVENLENTKKTAGEVEHKVKEAQTTELQINEAREHYRPAAARASLLYFILNDLNKIHPMYQFSLKLDCPLIDRAFKLYASHNTQGLYLITMYCSQSFSIVFEKAVKKAEPDENLKNRVKNLITSISFSVFLYTTRGLFEKHKIIFTAQMAFQILLIQKLINPVELDFLLRFPSQMNVTSPVDFLSNHSWGAVKLLSEMEEFRNLDRDIEGSAKRWKKLVESEAPEKEKLPQEWKNKNALQKLCIMRALRADRMTYAVRDFVEERLGADYVDTRGIPFEKSYEETGPATPTFFILSPGVDPLQDVEKLGKKLGFTFDNKKFHNVSLGQGQEVVAESALDTAAEHGHWVVLQNIHLVAKWLMALQNRLEKHSVGSHTDFRVFMSAEPAATAGSHIIPQGILENAIKITNEPPTGMHSNLHKAFDNFNQETLEMCAREVEFKSILFSLCYFHAVVSERRKFGPQGWNRVYPYNTGDLTISVNVLYNYLEANQKVPWDDLRYLFGEIMYGGHITDDWDRHLCRTYLKEYMNQDMFDNVIYLAPGFPLPPSLDYNGYHQYIDDVLPPESPYLYGLHPNAEIDFLTTTSDNLFRTILELMPRDTSSGAGAGPTRDEKIKSVLDEILEKLPEQFNMLEMMSKVEPADRTPYVVVAFQECERMNGLTNEIRSSLKTLDLGLKGELTITASMEALGNAMFLDSVPDSWQAKAYPSMSGLTTWYVDLLLRIKELENWTSDFQLPAAVWLGGFFNPQSFLTAIMQAMARKNEWPLDKMCLQCDVTKKNKEDFSSSPREGAYIHSLFMEGARWDVQTSLISEGILKDLTPTLPVIFIKAIPVDKQETRNIYPCPVYKTKMRGPTFVWTFNLKTKEKPAKWTLGGVAILLMV
uniref:Uncharacterized protein n=1 Tax=Ciona savignyi TaxID=51511 RepID=H2YYC1_CIOSA